MAGREADLGHCFVYGLWLLVGKGAALWPITTVAQLHVDEVAVPRNADELLLAACWVAVGAM